MSPRRIFVIGQRLILVMKRKWFLDNIAPVFGRRTQKLKIWPYQNPLVSRCCFRQFALKLN